MSGIKLQIDAALRLVDDITETFGLGIGTGGFGEVKKLGLQAISYPQYQFLKNAPLNTETLYGGAAGPGKTFADVILPIYHDFLDEPEFRMQIFRLTKVELEQEIIPLTQKLYPVIGGKFNESKLRWKFPSGATVFLCYMQYPGDWRRYQGGWNTVQAFDEATQLHPDNYTVEAWNRSKCRIKPFRVYTTNPGGPSHRKFKKEFIDICPAIPDGEPKFSKVGGMYWQPVKASDSVIVKKIIEGKEVRVRRQYIPARLFDNEEMLKNNPDYLSNLLNLPEEKRKMLLDGDWSYVAGMFFDRYSEQIHLWNEKPFDPPKSWARISGLDYGNVTCAEFIAEDHKGDIWVYREWTAINKSITYKAVSYNNYLEKIGEKNIFTVGDVNMFAESVELPEERAPANSFLNLGVKLVQVSKKPPENKRFRVWINDELKDLLDWEKKNGLFVKRPKIHIMAERCPQLVENLPLLEKDPDFPEDYMKEQDKTIAHWIKALQYALISRKRRYTDKDVTATVERMKAKARKSII
ncbi:MAG: hypothetical protein HOP31_11555 [Ignavibacteria bacterium]|nr:hypothetical protein [Ignavibacteria bacterium]